MTVGNGGSPHHVIRWIGGFQVKLGLDHGFIGHRLSGQTGFVHLQGDRLQEYPVGGNLFPLLQQHDIVHDDLLFRYLVHVTVANHFDQRVVVHLIQHVELLVRVPHEPRGHSRREQYGHGNTDGFRDLDDPFREIHGDGDAPGKKYRHH